MNKYRRQNNICDMTVREQIEKIKSQMCDIYCMFRHDAENSIVPNAQELLEEMHCCDCPLKKL